MPANARYAEPARTKVLAARTHTVAPDASNVRSVWTATAAAHAARGSVSQRW